MICIFTFGYCHSPVTHINRHLQFNDNRSSITAYGKETQSQTHTKHAAHAYNEIQPDDSASQAGRQSEVSATSLKASSVVRQFTLRQRKVVLEAELALERERHQLEIEQVKLGENGVRRTSEVIRITEQYNSLGLACI